MRPIPFRGDLWQVLLSTLRLRLVKVIVLVICGSTANLQIQSEAVRSHVWRRARPITGWARLGPLIRTTHLCKASSCRWGLLTSGRLGSEEDREQGFQENQVEADLGQESGCWSRSQA